MNIFGLVAQLPPGIQPIEFVIMINILIWIGMLTDCILNKDLNWKYKIIWLLIILFAPPIGPYIYLFIGFIGRFLRKKVPLTGMPYLYSEQEYQSYQQSKQNLEGASQEGGVHLDYEQPQAMYPERP